MHAEQTAPPRVPGPPLGMTKMTKMTKMTIGLILACVAIALYTRLNASAPQMRPFYISEYFFTPATGDSQHLYSNSIQQGLGFLPEVRSGQIWRLLTPIFIHFSLMHIIFNMMMLKELGGFIETRFGALYLLALVLATGIISNLGQALCGGPTFGGMSGVDYGLFGFLWIRGRFDPRATWKLNSNTIIILLVWLGLGFTHLLKDVVGNVANAAHTAGLAVGMLWGFFSSKK